MVGAGPAGLAAALTAADRGIRVVLLDAGAQAGGQFYRQPAAALNARRPQALHHAWGTWKKLRGGWRRMSRQVGSLTWRTIMCGWWKGSSVAESASACTP